MKYARKQPSNDAASARGVERLLDATLDRLHTAERRLWEMSLEGDGDALLPPALFQAGWSRRAGTSSSLRCDQRGCYRASWPTRWRGRPTRWRLRW